MLTLIVTNLMLSFFSKSKRGTQLYFQELIFLCTWLTLKRGGLNDEVFIQHVQIAWKQLRNIVYWYDILNTDSKIVCWSGCLANNHNGQMVFHYLLHRNTRFVTVYFVLMLIHLWGSNFQAACPGNILNLPLHLQNSCLN